MFYTLQGSRWKITWRICENRIERRCSLYDEGTELDPMEDSDLEKIHEILPDLMNAVKTALEAWGQPALLERAAWPEMLLYAERLRT